MTNLADLCARASQMYARVDAGAPLGIDALIDALLESAAPLARAHAAALSAHAWFAGLPCGRRPNEATARELLGPETAAPLAQYVLLGLRDRTVAFDGAGVLGFGAIAAELSAGDEPTAARLALARAWPSAVVGEAEGAEEVLRDVFDGARRLGMATVVVDCQTLSALARMRMADLPTSTRICRRASRMARTESLPQQEYLAHLLLARVRRHNGVPHLSTHILDALAGIATAPYQPWIRWERLLAGAILGDADPDARTPAERAVLALDRQTSAATRGNPAALRQARDALMSAVEAFPLVATEASDYSIALDPSSSPEDASSAMRRWLVGTIPLPPHGLYGAQPVAQEAGERIDDAGFVVAGPGRRARRALGAAAPLVGHVPPGADKQRRRARTETGLAVLAFSAPEPTPMKAFFREVYGFDHDPAVHTAVLNTLVSRMRAALGDRGELVRGESDLVLHFDRVTTLPDPRCAQPLEDRVLRVLVRAQSGTAKEAADRLGIPLRRIQEALKELSDEGACEKRRDGRQIAYVVQDTTFSPPTQV